MIEKISLKGKKVVLVGTAHISEESVFLVKETIEKEKPDVVGIELDVQRYKQLKQGQKWHDTNVIQLIQKGQTYLFLLNLLLANIQRQLGEKIGVKAGQEMIQAAEIAEEKNIPIALLDRDVKVTLKRALKKTKLLEKIKIAGNLFIGLFSEGEEITKEKIEKMKQKDAMTELMKHLSSTAPTVKEVLVDERDSYIAKKIFEAKGKKIVAVVGAGHLEGIKNNLLEIEKGKDLDLKELERIPPKNSFWKYLGLVVPLLFAVFLFYGFYAKGIEASINIIIFWFLITGILSAVGAGIARAHVFSVIAAFLAAPFTTLHPALASGWIAALVEAKFKAPLVKDFESLNKLNSYTAFQKNNVTHLLIVAAYTNIGSTIGVVIALPYILSFLA